MATQVILLERIEKLGNLGDVVSVKPGYARNFLLPQKKALRASKQNIAYFEAQKKHYEAENEKLKKDAEKKAKKIEDIKVTLIRQASESGQLYGSVNSRDVADGVTETSGETIERRMVQINQNFKTIGLFPVDVMLHPEVTVSVTINIARTPEEAEIQAKTGKALIAEDETEAPVEETQLDEKQLEGVLEDSALEAEKEKQAAAEQKAAEEDAAPQEEKAADSASDTSEETEAETKAE